MKLESDPTTIYGVTSGKAPFSRELTRADLQSNSPYNTYVVAGLPPGPICNPGRASILAATNPAARPLRSISSPTGRAGTPSPRRWPSTIATSRAGARSSASAGAERSRRRRQSARRARCPRHRQRVRPRDREPCRRSSWPWSCSPSWLSASPGSCAPIRRRWRACMRIGPGRAGRHRRRRHADLRPALPAGPAARAVRPGGPGDHRR